MINDQSPFSVALIHKLITISKNRSLKECFIQDYYLMQKMVVDPNFAEGVRCVLIEKGAKPKWSHSHIYEIS
jgi:enoyl-CoA hydratase/carnithine racemase